MYDRLEAALKVISVAIYSDSRCLRWICSPSPQCIMHSVSPHMFCSLFWIFFSLANRNRGTYFPPPVAGNFLSVTRKWSAGDKITLELPMSLRIEAIKGITVLAVCVCSHTYTAYLAFPGKLLCYEMTNNLFRLNFRRPARVCFNSGNSLWPLPSCWSYHWRLAH